MAYVDPDDYRMSLGDHLEDLRYRLILGIIGPLVASLIMLAFGKQVVAFLCRPLLVALDRQGLPAQLINPSVTSAFSVYLKVSFICGLVIGIPWLIYHLWKFIAPGLYVKERKFVTALIPGSVTLTLIGVSFMYYILLPFMLWFLINFSLGFEMPSLEPNAVERVTLPASSDHPETTDTPLLQLPLLKENPVDPKIGQAWIKMPENKLRVFGGDGYYEINLRANNFMTPLIQLETYISFVLWLGLAFAVAFQLPLVMLGLGYTGILSSVQMSTARPFVVLAFVIIAAIMTPPDVISQIGLAVPMYLLYEFGLVLVRRVEKQRAAEEPPADG
ncbi:preprotein translocase subunit TatC [Planctomycetales bacterium ZRK34]|nr:preprotein translocase subunit TatC [Planctomycetales bacterium ZRK34]